MSRHWRWCLATTLTAVVSLACLWTQDSGTTSLSGSSNVLAANNAERWYRGNLHTHSLWSDGDEYLEMIAVWYRDHQYDFLCFTDHNVLQRTERWIDVEKSAGKRLAYDKLRTRFPQDWIEERMREGRLEVKLKTFDQVTQRIADPGKYLLIQGEEITDRFQKKPVHINATNLQEPLPP